MKCRKFDPLYLIIIKSGKKENLFPLLSRQRLEEDRVFGAGRGLYGTMNS